MARTSKAAAASRCTAPPLSGWLGTRSRTRIETSFVLVQRVDQAYLAQAVAFEQPNPKTKMTSLGPSVERVPRPWLVGALLLVLDRRGGLGYLRRSRLCLVRPIHCGQMFPDSSRKFALCVKKSLLV